MVGVMKLFVPSPLGNSTPFVAALYQSITAPSEAVAERFTVPSSQCQPLLAEATVGSKRTEADWVTSAL